MTAPVVFGATTPVTGLLDSAILPRFLALPQNGKVAAEYVWIGGSGSDLRSKTRTLDKVPSKPEDLPIWNYDGSSTGQAPGEALLSWVGSPAAAACRGGCQGVCRGQPPLLWMHWVRELQLCNDRARAGLEEGIHVTQSAQHRTVPTPWVHI
jgi:hypothetical protein